MSEAIFCRLCGNINNTIEAKGFNTTTGKRNTAKQCPVNECGHYGRNHNYHKLHWYSNTYKCTKCGNIVNLDGY